MSTFLTRVASRLSSILYINGFLADPTPRIEGKYSSSPEEYSLTIVVKNAVVIASDATKEILTASINAALGADIMSAVKLLAIDIPSTSVIQFHIVLARNGEVDYHVSTMQ